MKVVNYKDKILYGKAREVADSEFGEKLDKLMSEMAVVMYGSRGVGLAGPQVGVDLRILVADMSYVKGEVYGKELVKMVNPVLLSSSENTVKAEEQCLSYPEFKLPVMRAEQITVSFKTPFGEVKEATYNDWEARVILHEIDHLDGITLYSRAGSMTKKKYDSMVKKKTK